MEDHGLLVNTTTTVKLDLEVSSTIMATATVRKGPPAETPQAIRLRTLVVGSFWAVILLLGVPLWWKTTSIYRAKLPLQAMVDWADGKVSPFANILAGKASKLTAPSQTCRPTFPLQILVEAPSIPSSEAQNLVLTTQHALDDLNDFSAHHLRLRLNEPIDTSNASSRQALPDSDSGYELWSGFEGSDEADLTLRLRLMLREGPGPPTAELAPYTSRINVYYSAKQLPSVSATSSPLATFIASELHAMFMEEQATIAHVLASSGFNEQPVASGNRPGQSSMSTGSNSEPKLRISPDLAEIVSRRATRSLKYADTYHLTFSLFTPGSIPSSWDVEEALQEYISPLLSAFSSISNFSIDTQVQLYASFSPSVQEPQVDESTGTRHIRREDLSAFINAAEWPLSPSIGAGPTINFVLYVPKAHPYPLRVAGNGGSSWLVPQWGGVSIINPTLVDAQNETISPSHLTKDDLRPAFAKFSSQLLSLLGVPNTPASLPLRLDTLTRIQAASLLLSASSTMGSLARLTLSLPNIPIPLTVANAVSRTLSHLENTCQDLRAGRFNGALAEARQAESEAERAFFEKSMVGQVYFPDEHKVAVYLPLLGPVGVPIVMAAIKELKRLFNDWKRRKAGR